MPKAPVRFIAVITFRNTQKFYIGPFDTARDAELYLIDMPDDIGIIGYSIERLTAPNMELV